MKPGWLANVLFAIGDYAAGALVGVLTAGAVHWAVSPHLDMVLAMILGMALGMVVHLVIGFMLSPVLGGFHAMIPASLIGMYGGMFFAMRETMQHPTTLRHAVLVGALFGVVMVAVLRFYDRALKTGQSFEEENDGSGLPGKMGAAQ